MNDKSVSKIMMKTGYLPSQSISPLEERLFLEGKKRNFTLDKTDRHYLQQVIKIHIFSMKI